MQALEHLPALLVTSNTLIECCYFNIGYWLRTVECSGVEEYAYRMDAIIYKYLTTKTTLTIVA